MQLSEIYIYPIKSLAGIKLEQAKVTLRGLEHDRRFMLTTPDGAFLTQRTITQMALIKMKIEGNNLHIWHKNQAEDVLIIPTKPTQFIGTQATEVWGHPCEGSILETTINQWFSKKLNTPCQLIYMTDESLRPVDAAYQKAGEIVSFADGFPYLVLGQSSMDDLNNRLEKSVDINRFRANLIFTGGQPFEEDKWQYFTIGDLSFRGTKPCARCQVPNINQETAEIEKEPNRTLAKFRRFKVNEKNKILFGMNACWEEGLSEGKNRLRIGDTITLI